MTESGAKHGMRVRVSARFVSDEDLVADMVRVASLNVSGTLTREQYDRDGHWHSSTIHRRLGGWTSACREAGLASGRPDLGYSDDDWMANIYEVWTAIGRQPSYGDVRGSRFSPEGYAHRYGSWTAALLAFQHWIERSERALATGAPDRAKVHERGYGRTPSLRLRFRVLQRDRFTCVSCGASPSTMPGITLHVDHLIAFSKGGVTVLDNLQTLCDSCNLGKGDL